MVEKKEDANDLGVVADDPIKSNANNSLEVVEKVEEKEPDVDDLRKELEDYKKRLEHQAQARFEAERQAQQAMQRSVQATNDKYDSEYHLVASALETTKNQASMLKAQQAEAMSVGDYQRAAELNEALNRNVLDHDRLASGLERMKTQPRPQYNPQQAQLNNQMEVANPLDELIHVVAKTSPRSAAWLETNRNKITDPKTLNKIRRAHEDAVDDGLMVDTDDYFRYVENRVGFFRGSEPLGEDPFSSAASSTTRRSAPPAAPVSRSGSPGQSRPGRITLTPEQKEAAEFSKMTYEEYFERMVEEKKRSK